MTAFDDFNECVHFVFIESTLYVNMSSNVYAQH